LRACAKRQYDERYFHPISFAGGITQPIAAIRTACIHEAQAAPTKQWPNQRRPIMETCGNVPLRTRSNASVQRVALRRRLRCYFFLPDAKPGCHPAAFWLGAAAIVLIFSFLGFLASRLLRCSPLAISISPLVRRQSPTFSGPTHCARPPSIRSHCAGWESLEDIHPAREIMESRCAGRVRSFPSNCHGSVGAVQRHGGRRSADIVAERTWQVPALHAEPSIQQQHHAGHQ
jgi:hypothetical protein